MTSCSEDSASYLVTSNSAQRPESNVRATTAEHRRTVGGDGRAPLPSRHGSFWDALISGSWKLKQRSPREGYTAFSAECTPGAPTGQFAFPSHQIVSGICSGKSNKEMAYELRASEASVSRYVARIVGRVRAKRKTMPLLRRALQEVTIPSGEVVHFAIEIVAHRLWSVSEAQVVRSSLSGISNAQIASRRRRSPHTVRNQLRSALLKADCRDLAELSGEVEVRTHWSQPRLFTTA